MKRFWTTFLGWIANRWLANYFEGARFSTGRSIIPGAVQDARFDASASARMELVRKSRYFEQNNALVNVMADRFEEFTIGAGGLHLIPASSNPDWNKLARDWFTNWSNACDLTSLQTFASIQGLAARALFIDGEIFILKTRAGATPKIQLIEGHRVETPPELRSQEGISVIDGVEIDQIGKPIAYWVREGSGKTVFYRRIDARNIEHLFEPSRVGQYRGLPYVYPVINDLHDLDDLQILEMQGAKENASITNVIKNAAGEIDPATLRRRRFGNTTIDSQGNSSDNTRIDGYREVLKSTTIALRTGEEMDQFKSDRPSVAIREFWDYLIEKICCGVGIPRLVCFPISKQGTVARAELDLANAFFRARSAVLAGSFQRIWLYVMSYATRQDISLADPPADWMRVNVRAPRAVNVDIGRNSAATLAELQAGATNFELIFAPLGLDKTEQLRIAAEEAALIRALADEFQVTPGEISSKAGEAIAALQAQEAAAAAAQPREEPA